MMNSYTTYVAICVWMALIGLVTVIRVIADENYKNKKLSLMPLGHVWGYVIGFYAFAIGICLAQMFYGFMEKGLTL